MSIPHEVADIKTKDETVEILGFFGAGGSKTVLDVSLRGLRRALAIPNTADSLTVQDQKWESVVLEVDHARFLADLGLLTIPEYRLEEVAVNGSIRPALAMTPFPELPFEIFDGKDGSKTWESGPLSGIDHFSQVIEKISPIKNDIAVLASAGVLLNFDSVSFASMPDGTMRLFLYDLQGMSITNQADESGRLSAAYAQLVINKLDNIFDFEQSRRFAKQGYDFSARQQLVAALMSLES